MGRAIIRKGDRTSHGGIVIQGVDSFIVEGQPIALIGHAVHCPKCSGTPTIVQDSQVPTSFMGMPVALDGMKTSCGAVLIASQQVSFVETASGGGGAHDASAAEDAFASMFSPYVASNSMPTNNDQDEYDQYFHLVNEQTGESLKNRRYRITCNGTPKEGITDENGETEKVSTSQMQDATIEVFELEPPSVNQNWELA